MTKKEKIEQREAQLLELIKLKYKKRCILEKLNITESQYRVVFVRNQEKIEEILGRTKSEDAKLRRRQQKEEFREKAKAWVLAGRAKWEGKYYFHLRSKIYRFISNGERDTRITVESIIKKFGEHPVCYLSGLPIDYTDPKSYSLDHFIARADGGDSNFENLRLANPIFNRMKHSHTHEKFIDYCQTVVNFANESQKNN